MLSGSADKNGEGSATLAAEAIGVAARLPSRDGFRAASLAGRAGGSVVGLAALVDEPVTETAAAGSERVIWAACRGNTKYPTPKKATIAVKAAIPSPLKQTIDSIQSRELTLSAGDGKDVEDKSPGGETNRDRDAGSFISRLLRLMTELGGPDPFRGVSCARTPAKMTRSQDPDGIRSIADAGAASQSHSAPCYASACR
jgi:hypothetical protein